MPQRSTIFSILFFFTLSLPAGAQRLLQQQISVELRQQKIADALNLIALKAGCRFSYNSDIISTNKRVSLSVKDKSVRQVLDMLLGGGYEYQEKDDYIILQQVEGPSWTVTGYVRNEQTGELISNASVYEPEQLVATLTNDAGYFRLKLKDKFHASTIRVSKSWFLDTTVTLQPGNNQEVSVAIQPKLFVLDSVVISKDPPVEDTWFGRLLLSSRQRMQTINIGKYFMDKPYQASLVPGLGTHGKMSGQVTNKFSFNLLGGYSAATNGFEIGGLFNIVKKDVQYAQVAGLINAVGGKVTGVQIAGMVNFNIDSVKAVQVAGFANVSAKSVAGLQAAGIYCLSGGAMAGTQISGMATLALGEVNGVQASGLINAAANSIDGVQVVGFTNYAKVLSGVQASGLLNVVAGKMKGVQVASFLNYAGSVEGMQIGFINIADTTNTAGLGLINIVFKGYHKLCVYNTEVQNINLAFKTGNKKLYNILLAGANIDSRNRAFSLGYGFGREMRLAKSLSFNPELTGQYIFLGNWEYCNMLARFGLNLNYQLGPRLAVFGGASLNYYHSMQHGNIQEGYVQEMPFYKTQYNKGHSSGWLGWNIGISLF